MSDLEHLRLLKQGVSPWNRWRAQNPDMKPSLRGANLRGVNWAGINLTEADLTGAHFDSAHLSFSNLDSARLNGALFPGAHIRGTNIRKASLRGAHLIGAALYSTDLSGSDLTNALMGYTTLGDIDLSSVVGLSKVRHNAPSIVGIDTIYRSKGNIPEAFLRGAGVPEEFIVYMRSLVANPVEFYSCFISYSTDDQEFAERLHADLQDKGVRCWFAPHDIQAGRKIHEQIDAAIRLHEKLLLILSPDSMNSEWVKTEIAKARKRELRDNRRVLFPIRLVSFEALRDWECFDADSGKDSAREIREYFIPDFSNWKNHDSYQKGLGRLLRDLKAETPAASKA